jgi:hypothetical protein
MEAVNVVDAQKPPQCSESVWSAPQPQLGQPVLQQSHQAAITLLSMRPRYDTT